MGEKQQFATVWAGSVSKAKQRLMERVMLVARSPYRRFINMLRGRVGELSSMLHRRLRQSGLQQHVRYLGWQDEDGLRDAFRASDLLFLPSEAEGIALVLYEAMAAGLAVLASDVGGQAELVSSDCGRLVAPGRAEDYAQALQELLACPQALRQMGEAARSRILSRFSLAHFVQHLEQLLADVESRPWLRLPTHPHLPRPALARLQWQWSLHRLLVRFNQERLASMPLLGRPLSLLLKGSLYVVVWSIGLFRWERSTTP